MRSAYIVCYDISDPGRLRRVYKTMLGFGDHIQFSVFRCELSAADRVRLISGLQEIIHHKDDQVLLIDIGPCPGRADTCCTAVGRPYAVRERCPLVV